MQDLTRITAQFDPVCCRLESRHSETFRPYRRQDYVKKSCQRCCWLLAKKKRHMDRIEERAIARRAVESLPERERVALLMREEGLDYNEISKALSIARASVGLTLSQARRRLSDHFDKLRHQAAIP